MKALKTILQIGLIFVLPAFIAINPVRAQDSTITNARVVEMAKLGLDDDIIIAKVKNAKCSFQLADNDLIELKKSGVSSKVIAAMLDTTAITVAHVTIDRKPVEVHTLGQAKVGGRLGSAFTYGIKSVKEKAYLQGAHSSVIVGLSPTIELELPKDDTIDNYIVVRMDGKGDRRELEVGSMGGIVGSKSGIRAEAIHKTNSTPLGNNKFKMTVSEPLKAGEYIIYVVGSADSIKGVHGKGYDFTVE